MKLETVGVWIKRHRLAHTPKMCQEELAKAANVSRSYISLLERGSLHPDTHKHVTPDLETLDRIAAVFAAGPRFVAQKQNELRRVAANDAGYIHDNEQDAKNADEIEMLELYRGVPEPIRTQTRALLRVTYELYSSPINTAVAPPSVARVGS